MEHYNYIPLSIDETYYFNLIEDFLESHPKIKSLNKDRLLGFISLLKTRYITTNKSHKNNDWITLHSDTLKKQVGKNYKHIRAFWEWCGIIKCDGKYQKNAVPLGYKFSDFNHILAPTKRIIITDTRYKNNLTKAHKEKLDKHIKTVEGYEYLTMWFNSSLKLDYPDYVCSCEYQKMLDFKINEHQYNLKVDTFGNRFHSPLTRMSSELREHLYYDNHKLHEIDIQCSQPYLSIRLLFDELKKNHNNVYKKVKDCKSDEGKIKILNRYHKTLPKLGKYILAVKNDLYGTLREEYISKKGINIVNRKTLKELVFIILFSKNKGLGFKKDVFKSSFPFVYEIFKKIKSPDVNEKSKLLVKDPHKRLSQKLQRLESKIVLKKTCKEIADKHPEVPIYTIHDSILTTETNIEIVKAIFFKNLKNEIGFDPVLRVKES